jgi:exosome complex component RRP4
MIVVPGENIVRDSGLIRGHGAYSASGSLVSSQAGSVEQVNKLVHVRPAKKRYIGEVGDIVVGRVVEVGSKSWKLDVQGQKNAILHLSSINLPGGEQRMRNYEDQLQMRRFFEEGDLISAEVQGLQNDGSTTLHTRSHKFGKLTNGQLYVAPTSLIGRLKQHTVTLPCGIDVILGKNGLLWITVTRDEKLGIADEVEAFELDEEKHANKIIMPDERIKICRVRNSIAILCGASQTITPDSIMKIYRRSEELELTPKQLLDPGIGAKVLNKSKPGESSASTD